MKTERKRSSNAEGGKGRERAEPDKAPLAEMPETPLLALKPGTAATMGIIRDSVSVSAPRPSRRD